MSDGKKESMFARLAKQQTQAALEDAEPVTDAAPLNEPPPSPAPPALAKPKKTAVREKAAPARGKRDNPDYCQANAYLPKKLRRAVDRALLDVEGVDYSSLVEDLLRKWVKSKGVAE